MTKETVIEAVAKDVGAPKALVARTLDALFHQMTDALRAGQRVNLSPFGRFTPATKPARTVRNPKTGESVQVPERRTVRFRPGRALLEALAPGHPGTPEDTR